MPKSFNQKLKVLYLVKIFTERTDEEHPIDTKELQAYLLEHGIIVERKTIYDDIESLMAFGMDIRHRRKKPSGYYLGTREFELAELKFLVDAVQSCKFITQKKSRELIRKLEKLASIHDIKSLQNHIFVGSPVKTMNEDVYGNIEELQKALSGDWQISFQYYEWTVSKEIQLKKGGERYLVSPWELLWKDENYYLVAIDEKSGIVKHYRVDKMLNIQVEKNKRSGSELFNNFDAASFVIKTFGMFGGREASIRLECENRFVGVIIDRFGQDVIIHKSDEEHFICLVRVNISNQFFGWLAGLGPGIKIVSPEKTQKDYVRFLKKAMANYITH